MEEIKEHCLDHPTHARYLLAWEPDTRGAFNTIASARYFVYQCNWSGGRVVGKSLDLSRTMVSMRGPQYDENPKSVSPLSDV